MLTTAIEAGLPLIIVSTTDTLHAAAVVKHLSGQGRVRVVEAPAGSVG